MLGAPPEPKACVEPVLPNDRAGEADSSLNDDPGLLRIDAYRSAFSGDGGETLESATEDWRLAGEVLGKRMAGAGMP